MSLEALKRIKENPLYARIISYFVHRSDEDDNIRAVYIIGSLAQKDSHPTKYSDLDIELVVKDNTVFLQNTDWVQDIQKAEFAYEQTPSDGNGSEIRALFSEGMKSVDFTFLTPKDFNNRIANKQYRNGVFGRGVISLVDKDEMISNLRVEKTNTIPPLNQQSFNREYKNLLFHLIYAKNKIQAGELLTAKNTIDVSVRESLMKFIRWEEHLADTQKDLWHRARHFEKWADESHQLLIKDASPTYNAKEMEKSLLDISRHILRIANNISKQTGIPLEYNKDISNYLSNPASIVNMASIRKKEYV